MNIATVGIGIGIDIDIGKSKSHPLALGPPRVQATQASSRSGPICVTTNTPAVRVASEPRAGAHFLGREAMSFVPKVAMLSAPHLKVYVKSQRNHLADTGPIAEAAKGPTMRFLPVKPAGRQALQLLSFQRNGSIGSGACLQRNWNHLMRIEKRIKAMDASRESYGVEYSPTRLLPSIFGNGHVFTTVLGPGIDGAIASPEDRDLATGLRSAFQRTSAAGPLALTAPLAWQSPPEHVFYPSCSTRCRSR